jgi:hypothetical protein
MAYKTRVKCLVKLLLEFYANIGRAHLRRSMGHSQPGVETPEIALKKPPVKFVGQLFWLHHQCKA